MWSGVEWSGVERSGSGVVSSAVNRNGNGNGNGNGMRDLRIKE